MIDRCKICGLMVDDSNVNNHRTCTCDYVTEGAADGQGKSPPPTIEKPKIKPDGQCSKKAQSSVTNQPIMFSVRDSCNKSVGELCVSNMDGDYLGTESGKVYKKDDHHRPPMYLGRVLRLVYPDKTGMLHLSDDSSVYLRKNFIGKFAVLEEAHKCDSVTVYRAYFPEGSMEYFSEDELEIEDQIA